MNKQDAIAKAVTLAMQATSVAVVAEFTYDGASPGYYFALLKSDYEANTNLGANEIRATVAVKTSHRGAALRTVLEIVDTDKPFARAVAQRRRRDYPRPVSMCADCGKPGERTGHQDCQFPNNH